MNLKGKISSVLDLVNEILNQLVPSKFNSVPLDLPNLTLHLVKIKAKFESLLPERVLHSINPVSMLFFIDSLSGYLQLLLAQAKLWKGNLKKNQEDELVIINSKIETLTEFLEVVPYVPVDDLFCLETSHPRWVALEPIIDRFHTNKAEQIKRKYKKVMEKVASGQAFVSKAYEEEEGVKRKLMLGIGSMYYTLMKSKALRKTHLLYAKPRLDVAVHVWNLLETKMLRVLIKLVMKSIKLNQVIYVPRTASNVTSEYEHLEVPSQFSLDPNAEMVMCRVLNTQNLAPFTKKVAGTYSKAIIHIHGGGFISMSSASHQVYSRIWAKDVGVPLFSIDYRLAPNYPFPAGLDDVWQTFHWLLNYGPSQLGVSLEDYVIVGDSAGGNLTMALAYKIITSGLKPPSGLVLAYPALNLDKDAYSPSLLFALECLLVPHTFLKLCLEAYLQHNENIKDPLISPIMIEEEILGKFPPVRIMVGTEDPLHDECFRLAEKMNSVGADIKIAEFCGASHGGLNLCFKGGIKESKEMTNLGTTWMREFLKCS